MRIVKWGSSLAVRLPAAVVDAMQLREGAEIELHVMGARNLEVTRKLTHRQLLSRLHKHRGWLPADFRFDRHGPV